MSGLIPALVATLTDKDAPRYTSVEGAPRARGRRTDGGGRQGSSRIRWPNLLRECVRDARVTSSQRSSTQGTRYKLAAGEQRSVRHFHATGRPKRGRAIAGEAAAALLAQVDTGRPEATVVAALIERLAALDQRRQKEDDHATHRRKRAVIEALSAMGRPATTPAWSRRLSNV